MRIKSFASAACLSTLITIASTSADDHEPLRLLPDFIVKGKMESLVGEAPSASYGITSSSDLELRPLLRPGELLEVVPGMIITQHSGGGKGNQFFLRGFNLDHGTDFYVEIDSIPTGLRTHAHGQGYIDLNILIPELVETVEHFKGPYFAELGDFSTAGAARFRYFDALPHGIASFTIGENNFYRSLVANTISLGSPPAQTMQPMAKSTIPPLPVTEPTQHFLTYAMEYNTYDGPWELPENLHRINALLKYAIVNGDNRLAISAMAYHGQWDATDQIPQRLIDSGELNRFGFIDPTSGGQSSRFTLGAELDRIVNNGSWHASAYAGYYDLELFSNFTYFLENPERGDQFEQNENRLFLGGKFIRNWQYKHTDLRVGTETRHDFIDNIGLYNSQRRQRFNTIREDDVYIGSIGLFADASYAANHWLRIQPGVRADIYHFNVTSDNPLNSGNTTDGILSPKLGLIFGPWNETEFYLNSGFGFHSNDARGTVLRVDPDSGKRTDAVTPLVRTFGAEAGIRTQIQPRLTSTLSAWYLESDSELIYEGDEGTNDAGPASRRYGIEWGLYHAPTDWLRLDSELSLTHARLRAPADENRIPESVPLTWASGITIGKHQGFYGALRGRFFAASPLDESGNIKSNNSFQLNSRAGWRNNQFDISLQVLNLLNRKDNDIAYFYESRLPWENTGVEDVHLHPMEPRTVRLNFTYRF